MITTELIKKTADGGIPALKNLFEKLPKEDALLGLGILAVAGIAWGISNSAFKAIVELITRRFPINS